MSVSSIAAASARWARATSSPVSTTSCGCVSAPDAREGEQVVDQLLHPLGAVDGERDVLVAALVELALVALLEHLAEARDLAQRLLQVVRRDVRELLELGVRALELLRLADQVLLRALELGDLADDAPAHGVDVGAEVDHLAGAAGLQRAAEAAARDLAHVGGQARERVHDDPPQHQARGRDGGQQRDAERDEAPRHDVGLLG